jgi:hypothetical protein
VEKFYHSEKKREEWLILNLFRTAYPFDIFRLFREHREKLKLFASSQQQKSISIYVLFCGHLWEIIFDFFCENQREQFLERSKSVNICAICETRFFYQAGIFSLPFEPLPLN